MKSQDVVYVGLSGGVDSAVSAALLQKQGYDVVGVFIKIWQPEFLECTWERDRLDAMRVAAHLSIPFREIDLSQEYKKYVVEEMVAGYKRGETPNPDTACNQYIKFGTFFDWARNEGASYVATGHYARIGTREKKYTLLRGSDTMKDQSYFLYTLTQEHLAHALFPIGDMKKSDVRILAGKMSIPTARKPDSQGLCFVGDVSMGEFLSRYIPQKTGVVENMKGRAIGTHGGAALYTTGQRHGFFVFKEENIPHFVVSTDTKRNVIIVSSRKEQWATKNVALRDVHWISGAPSASERIVVEVRYRGRATPCTVTDRVGRAVVALDEACVVALGQVAVFYREDECLGGGTVSGTYL